MAKVEKEFFYLYLWSITLIREMGLNQYRDDVNDSSISSALSGLRQNRPLAYILVITLVLVIAAIVFSILELNLLAAVSAGLVIPLMIMIPVYFSRSSRQQHEQMKEMQKLIEAKERYLSDFSHRIRTPLNNFSFIIEYLIDQKPEGNQKEMLETLIASTTNMVEAVNDLTMKTAQVISFEPRKEIRFNLYRALTSTIELFEANSDGVIKFISDLPDAIKRDFTGDPITIKQIFLDLFNQIQTDADGIVSVSLNAGISGESKGITEVTFAIDTDCQVPGFDTVASGEGRINSMAAKLILGLNGKYSTGQSQQGSIFSFSLPLRTVKEETSQSKAAERIKALENESSTAKKLTDANVLLVEDNPTNQKIVLITLKSVVRNIDTAVTGKEALDKFGTSNYDIILMDIQLPVMDGITVARKIREIERSTMRHTPIIAITANAMIGDKEKCLSAGMDEYLSKPFQPSRLIDIIESFVTSKNR